MENWGMQLLTLQDKIKGGKVEKEEWKEKGGGSQ